MARIVNPPGASTTSAPAANPSVLDLSALLGGSRFGESQPSSKRVKDLIEEFEEKANNRVPRVRPASVLSVNLSRTPTNEAHTARSLTITFDAATDLCFTARSLNNESYNFQANSLPPSPATARFRILIEPLLDQEEPQKKEKIETEITETNDSGTDAESCASIDRVLGPLRSHLSDCSNDDGAAAPVETEPAACLYASRQLAQMVGVPQRQGESVLETLVRTNTIAIRSRVLGSVDESSNENDEIRNNILLSDNVVCVSEVSSPRGGGAVSSPRSSQVESDNETFTPSRAVEGEEGPLLMIPPPDHPVIIRPRDAGTPRVIRLPLNPPPSYTKEEELQTESPSSLHQAFPTDWTPQSHLRRTVSSSWPPGSQGADDQPARETKSQVASSSSSESDDTINPPPPLEEPPTDFFQYSQRIAASGNLPPAPTTDVPKMTRARKRREQRKRRREKLRSELGSLMMAGESGLTSQTSSPLPSQRKKFMVNGNISGYVHDRGAVIVANFNPSDRLPDDWAEAVRHRDSIRAERVFSKMKRMVPPRQPVQYHVHGHHHHLHGGGYYVHRDSQRMAMSLTSSLVEDAIKHR